MHIDIIFMVLEHNDLLLYIISEYYGIRTVVLAEESIFIGAETVPATQEIAKTFRGGSEVTFLGDKGTSPWNPPRNVSAISWVAGISSEPMKIDSSRNVISEPPRNVSAISWVAGTASEPMKIDSSASTTVRMTYVLVLLY